VLDGVSALVDQSLLKQEEGYGGESRFVFLETIHEYAREKLEESGEAGRVRERHANFFLALAEEKEPFLMGPDQQEWLERLEQESDNFRTALAWCLREDIEPVEARHRLEIGLRMAAALARFWTRHSHMCEGREWIEMVVSRADRFPGLRRGTAGARALYGAGVIAFSQSDQQAAASLLEESLSIYQDLNDKHGVANALMYLGLVKGYLVRHVEEGRPLLEESIRLHRELEDTWGLAMAISCMGYLPLVEREYAKARALFEEALPLFEMLGDIWAVGWVKLIMGEAARCQGDYATAATLYEQSLALHRELGDKHRIAVASNNLGYVYLHQGDYDRAATYLRESMVMLHETGSEARMLSGIPGLAAIASAKGERERAARLLGAAQAQAEACGFNFEPPELLAFEQNVAALRSEMDKVLFAKAWEEGLGMTWSQAIAYAMEETCRDCGTTTAPMGPDE
jgi:tetratricopeptide (TPR) repeat protein